MRQEKKLPMTVGIARPQLRSNEVPGKANIEHRHGGPKKNANAPTALEASMTV